jgi:hypothetical protein
MSKNIPHSLGGFRGAFESEHGRKPTEQEIWNAAICSWRDLHPQATEPAWRPIETAPKDGSEILLAHPDGSMVVGWWCENGLHGRVSGWSDGDDFAMTWPSHWMPIPAAPEAKQ